MQEIVIISGKGGAGKTSITAAFAHIAKNAIICDLDVDTPDLHILLNPTETQTNEFWSGYEAILAEENCSICGSCLTLCKFDAITQKGANKPVINSLRCEGCKVCAEFCSEHAIVMKKKLCGNWFLSNSRFGPMVHALLFPGQENSGRLVSLLKQEARSLAKKHEIEIILADGAPGIGCPVISSLQGASLAVIVTEPTPSGKHDFERVAQLCDHFRLKTAVIINKYDLNIQESDNIKKMCLEKGYIHVVDLPYDPSITKAMINCKAVTETADSAFTKQLETAWAKLLNLCGLRVDAAV